MIYDEGTERVALYRLYDKNETLLYVGITSELRRRYQQHAESKAWWSKVAVRDAEWLPSRTQALRAEGIAIRREKPKFNVQGTSRPKQTKRAVSERSLKHRVAYMAYRIEQSVLRRGGSPGQSEREVRADSVRWRQAYKLASGLDFKDLDNAPPEVYESVSTIPMVRGARKL